MRRYPFQLAVLAAMPVAIASVAVPDAQSAEPSVLIVSEEGTRGAEMRGSKVFRTALIEVAGAFVSRGMTPKGAEEVLPKGSYKPKGGNRLEVWLAAAGRAEPPVDVLVGITLIVSVIERSQSRIIEISISTSSHTVPDGKALGGFATDKPRRYPLAPECGRKCVVAEAIKAVGEVAREAGAATAEKVAAAKEG